MGIIVQTKVENLHNPLSNNVRHSMRSSIPFLRKANKVLPHTINYECEITNEELKNRLLTNAVKSDKSVSSVIQPLALKTKRENYIMNAKMTIEKLENCDCMNVILKKYISLRTFE